MRIHLPRLAVLLLILSAIATPAIHAATTEKPPAIDPFYTNLLQEGEHAADLGNLNEAASDLRIACFGLLEDPPLLAQGLVRLAIVQINLGDQDSFLRTFQRVLEIESRFHAYSRAKLQPTIKKQFEQLALRQVPPQLLKTSPTFDRLLAEQQQAEIARLPRRQRRTALDNHLASDPSNPVWARMLAALDIEEGRQAEAQKLLAELLKASPGDHAARCLRGQIAAAGGDCAEAEGDLVLCENLKVDPKLASAALGCMIANRHWSEAHRLLAALPPAVANERGLTRLAAALAKAENLSSTEVGTGTSTKRAAAPGAVPSPSLPAVKGVEGVSGNGSAGAAGRNPATTSAEEQETVAHARQIVDNAHKVSDLDHAMDLVRPLAEAHPHDPTVQFLAAEIAYRSSHWSEAVKHFELGGMPPADQPILRFYFAVSLYESGEAERAANVLSSCIDKLQRTPFVQRYAGEILGPRHQ